jgi:hypothetical protein
MQGRKQQWSGGAGAPALLLTVVCYIEKKGKEWEGKKIEGGEEDGGSGGGGGWGREEGGISPPTRPS